MNDEQRGYLNMRLDEMNKKIIDNKQRVETELAKIEKTANEIYIQYMKTADECNQLRTTEVNLTHANALLRKKLIEKEYKIEELEEEIKNLKKN